MTIVFFENFSNDDAASIEKRHPGSYRGAPPTENDHPQKWPFFGRSTFRARGLPIVDSTVNRIEIVLGCSSLFPETGATGTRTFEIFGIPCSSNNTSVTIAGEVYEGTLFDATKLHIIVDIVEGGKQRLIVLKDDVVILGPATINVFFTDFIGNSDTTNYRMNNMFSHIDYIVVAHNTEPGTRLRTPTFETSELTLGDVQNYNYVETGILEDTNTADPNRLNPNIYTTGEGSVAVESQSESRFYISANSDKTETRIIVGEDEFGLAKSAQHVLPVYARTNIIVGNKELQEGVCNDDNVCFLGEIQGADFATFTELSTLCGVTAGTLNNIAGYDTYLHFIMDGEEVIVPKVSVRHSISWQQIYQAGCVYGYDGFGSNPSGPLVNQNKIITIKGKNYRVSLLKGLDGSLPNTLGNDVLGSYRSEWSRLFYPMCSNDANIKSYTSPRLAGYTKVMLGMENVNGRYSWVQETPSNNPANRFLRAYDGPSYLSSNTDTAGNDWIGWRPALRPID